MTDAITPCALTIKSGQTWRTKDGHTVRIIVTGPHDSSDSPHIYAFTGAYVGSVRVKGSLSQQFNNYGESRSGDKLEELLS